ncbi:hypothetical protein NEAUS03_2117 [Nematocida ausubeli]|nr:hypothetical protein NEAUS03_2117 [Nematocida ausubeli]
MVCLVGIFYCKKAYSAGELISGYITLQIPSVISIESIVLTIDKESEIKVDEVNSKLVSNERATRHLGRFIIYGNRTKRMLPGVHTFPFNFRMVSDEGATIEYKKITQTKNIYALNKYISRCEVKIYGIFKPVAKYTREIHLIEPVLENIQKINYKHQINNCLCFGNKSTEIFIVHDSVLYAGKTHSLELSLSPGASIGKIECQLEMNLCSFTDAINPITLLFPCKTTEINGKITLVVDETVPSETSRNDFFSISYNMVINVEIKGTGTTRILRPVSVRGKDSYGEYTPPEIPESAIYPEKYLSLHC